ncbi:hypothetical protein GCM10009107_38200 [Ideonella azotifigens]|uniref:Uncharacterized protein n=1 Tax=Ideonella azotifigens TaxID=513160 RepID=A0ABP3VG31_9BURK
MASFALDTGGKHQDPRTSERRTAPLARLVNEGAAPDLKLQQALARHSAQNFLDGRLTHLVLAHQLAHRWQAIPMGRQVDTGAQSNFKILHVHGQVYVAGTKYRT